MIFRTALACLILFGYAALFYWQWPNIDYRMAGIGILAALAIGALLIGGRHDESFDGTSRQG